MFKAEDTGLDVKELTESIENMNGKSLNYWLCNIQMSTDFPRISGHLDIVSNSLKISSSFSLGIQTHARDVVYMQ